MERSAELTSHRNTNSPKRNSWPFAAKTEGAIAGAESPHPIDTPNTVSNGQRARVEQHGTQIGYAQFTR